MRNPVKVSLKVKMKYIYKIFFKSIKKKFFLFIFQKIGGGEDEG
jgi:hypothetical protein